jgi:hypothetical protein
MILLGVDKEINSIDEFAFLNDKDELNNITPNTLAIFNYNKEDLATYNLDIPIGVKIASLSDFIFLINTKVAFAICEQNIAIEVQKCADCYLTDIKVVAIIKDDKELLWVGKNEIDGAIKIS